MQQEEMLLKRDAVIIGAGRIGRGFLAEMFLDAGCNITFADTDHSLIDALNRAGSYRLMKTSGKTDETVEISGYRAIYADNDSDMLDAVSYTHLDVYKRQAIWSAWKPHRRWRL